MRKNIIWISIFIVISIVCTVFIIQSRPSDTVEIKKDGELLYTIDLNKVSEPYTIVIGEGENTVYVEHGNIRITSASCPDKLCTKMSLEHGIPIVCLPNKVAISSKTSEFDATT